MDTSDQRTPNDLDDSGEMNCELSPNVPISVVIGVCNGGTNIIQCLETLYPLAKCEDAEIIVAEASDDDIAENIRRRFPSVRLLHFSDPRTIHQLRGLGIAKSRGNIIGLIDAFSIVDDNWLTHVLKAHRERSNLAIGGIVELYDAAAQSFASWTMYIHEYARFMDPRAAGQTDILAASNISYKREALFDRSGQPRFREFWKELVNREMKSSGQSLWMDPNIVVRVRKTIPFRDFLRTRYDNGRCFAGMRAVKFATTTRILFAAATLLLPWLLLWRCANQFSIKRPFWGKFLLTLPLQLVLFTWWSIGEFVGYLRGPGSSCETLHY